MAKCRDSLLQAGVIIKTRIPPRRLWDLHSNRAACLDFEEWRRIHAVSHSWVEEDHRTVCMTPVNGSQWGVPIPCDISLERVRIELLNFGAEHAWLDVLCLRQYDPDAEGEAVRKTEWAIDVPMIGSIYAMSNYVVHYFNGLGRPFAIGDVNGQRHWLNRAWTLQELGAKSCRHTGGITEASPKDPWKDLGFVGGPFYDGLAAMEFLESSSASILNAMFSMRNRACSNALDRVAGLAYPLQASKLVMYDSDCDPGRAWELLLPHLEERVLACLSAAYPFPGSGGYRFVPTWQQLLSYGFPSAGSPDEIDFSSSPPFGDMEYVDNTFRGKFPCIRSRLDGLTGSAGQTKRQGTATILANSGSSDSIQRVCVSSSDIADGLYDLVILFDFSLLKHYPPEDWDRFPWLVGHEGEGQFEKLAVVSILSLIFPQDWEPAVTVKDLVLL
ncbi:hypothetical protein BKA70DRAFT_1112715 [Coprinopsis sp. MPI-PUGE-AT-0042]|nr:hypothetical protein BKA70DRAFT_1112715 [Coprinopsis sp. MPI-PUGE-AT-0042]